MVQVPLAPAEDILSWLERIGLLETEEQVQEEEEALVRGDGLLDDEFDLDAEGDADGGLGAAEGGALGEM